MGDAIKYVIDRMVEIAEGEAPHAELWELINVLDGVSGEPFDELQLHVDKD